MGLELQYLSWLAAGAIFLAVGAVVVLLGLWSLAGTSKARKWTAIGARLAVVALLILIIAGVRFTREHEDLEIIVVNDASASMDLVGDYPGRGRDASSIQDALQRYYQGMMRDPTRKPNDRRGIVSFRHYARPDLLPTNNAAMTPPVALWAEGTGSDMASGIRMALATFSPDVMRRIVLVSDGNSNLGDLDAAVEAAVAQNVPIDVVPLRYDVQNDVMVERFNAPEWRRQNEVFDVEVVMQSTNAGPATGTLRVKHLTAGAEADLDVDPTTPGVQPTRRVTINPGLNKFIVRVPAQSAAGVHRFQAIFTPDSGSGGATQVTDSVARNNTAEAFTVVRGRGQVLFVDGSLRAGATEAEGDYLYRTLLRELTADQQPADRNIEPIRRIPTEQFPRSAADLQGYYAIVLYNVSRGGQMTDGGNVGGLSLEQDAMLRGYVHDMGGGLLMIGGPDTFGAGGWTNSELEKVLPVNMDVPAQRNVGKGALALIIHSCEMPDGNYWGQQCAIGAIKSLSVRDEVSVISYGWGGSSNQAGIGGAQFDVPFTELRNREAVIDAVKRMRPGDMPSFDDAINLAVNGAGPTPRGLKHVKAQHKHILIISDGDPAAPQESLIQQCLSREAGPISISTITVYPHQRGDKKVPPVMSSLPERLKGKFYGPIEDNPQQLPQLFIKEAQIVKRSLIQENLAEGLKYSVNDGGDELIRLLPQPLPPIRGLVLTTRKNDPKVVMPLAVDAMKDPVLAYWQSGLGKAAVWTADAHNMWGSRWVGTDGYATLFAGIIRKISRPPQSSDYSVTTKIEGDRGEIIVDAMNDKGETKNFLRIKANVLGGRDAGATQEVQLVQIAPGKYRGTFNASSGGGNGAPFVVAASVEGEAPIYGGAVKSGTIEDRALRSNDAKLREIAERTRGRELPPFDVANAALFTRDGIIKSSSPQPIWQTLLPILLGLIIIDVAVRRIAWDWIAIKRLAAATAARVRAFTASRRIESKETLDALRKKREEVAETRFKPTETTAGPPPLSGARPPVPSATSSARPDPKAKFTGEVEGDISQVIGGATDKPIPPAPKKVQPKGGTGDGGHLGGLMAAKKRAQQQIKEKEQGEG